MSEEQEQTPVYTNQNGFLYVNGKMSKGIKNIVNFFKVDDLLKNLFHYNEFNSSFEYAKNFQWPEHDRLINKNKRIEDEDIVFIQYYLAHNKAIEWSIDKIRNALLETADRNSYHPVKEYLKDLEWDGESRLESWLIKGCGVEENIYTKDVGKKWLTAAVTRIYSPGYKFDYVLVLEGKENIGKSTALRVFGDPWFTDSVTLLQKEQDIVAKMIGNWVVELAEMQGVGKRDKEFIKAFISCQFDDQRLAFRRDPKKYPRQSVFAGTSNNMAYLLDEDGNRRFWPVKCEKINIQWIKDNRDQLFAEAKHLYDIGIYPFNENGEKLFLEGESLELSKKYQKMRLSGDEVLEEVIEKYLIGKNETTMGDILLNCIGHKLTDSNTRAQQTIIGRILRRLGFEKKDRSLRGKDRYSYVREQVVNYEMKIEEELF